MEFVSNADFFFSPDRNENPAVKKAVGPAVVERLEEARASALEQLFFERGVAMESWIGSLIIDFFLTTKFTKKALVTQSLANFA